MNTISLLKAADLPLAWHIERRCHEFHWSETLLNSNQGEGYLNYRIDVNGVMAGFAITRIVADEATLFNIAIDPDYQRRGLARELLDYIIDILSTKKIATLWLEVRMSNTPARALYQQAGFSEVTLRRDYYPTQKGREHAVVMALALAFYRENE